MQYLLKPWQHQLDSIARARKERDFALFHEMGTGKTGTAINILREHFALNKRIMRTLILGPVIVVKNWQAEIAMHSKIPPGEVVPLQGAGKKRCATFAENAVATDGTLTRGRIFITNYESVEMDELFDLIQQWNPEVLICDESQRLKNHKSVRAQKVTYIADRTKHNYILSGTPFLNSPTDIYHQYRILDRGASFALRDKKTGDIRPMNFHEFRGIFMEDENAGMPKLVHFPKWVPRAATAEELGRKIYRKATRVMKSECLDLPPLVRQRVRVELGPEQRRMYEEMKKEFITWVESPHAEPRAVVAQMALTKALRLQQIVSGFVKTEDGVEVPIKDNPRLTALGEIVEDLCEENKVIIWATFKHNYKQIAELLDRLAIPFVEIHGGISHEDRERNMHAFRKDPKVRAVIANQLAAGIGINLVEASYSLFYSRNFSLEQDLQAEARNYRGGSEIHDKVTRLDLVAENTIDEAALVALAGKKDMAEEILSWGTR